MIYAVLKPFNIVNRRLPIGAQVTEADDLAPFNLDERIESGFLVDAEPKVSKPAPAVVEQPAPPAARVPSKSIGSAVD